MMPICYYIDEDGGAYCPGERANGRAAGGAPGNPNFTTCEYFNRDQWCPYMQMMKANRRRAWPEKKATRHGLYARFKQLMQWL
jgi:hypothetical protein